MAAVVPLTGCSSSESSKASATYDELYPHDLHENMGAAPYDPDHHTIDGDDAGDGGTTDGGGGDPSDASPDGGDAGSDAATDAELPETPI